LCAEFLQHSREHGPYPVSDYREFIAGGGTHDAAEAGFAASRARLSASRGAASLVVAEHDYKGRGASSSA
ncbi:MAG: hypothetical protein WA982_05965, partial [Rubrobacteraceae bacterium]